MALSLPDSPRKLIFRTLVSLFQKDPDLKRIIQPNSWKVWSGNPTDNASLLATGMVPAARLTPIALPASPETQAAQNSPMGIQLDVAVSGLNIDDLLNLWSAFERVIFVGDGAKTAVMACNIAILAANTANPTTSGALGASVQQLYLGMPVLSPSPVDAQDLFLTGTGTILVQMLIRK